MHRRSKLVREIAREIRRIAVGLKADQIVVAKRRDQLLVVRHGREDLRRGHRNVKEEANSVLVTAPSQRFGQWHQVIVMHPHEIVGPEYLIKLSGKVFIDSLITGEIPSRELGEVESVVQDRPQDAVRKAVVVLLVVVFGQVRDDIRDAILRNGMRARFAPGFDLAAPAEPNTRVSLERRAQRNFKAARMDAVAIRLRHAIRDYDDACQYRSSQLRDKRMALKIRPAIE
jgi:hypothetical protein